MLGERKTVIGDNAGHDAREVAAGCRLKLCHSGIQLLHGLIGLGTERAGGMFDVVERNQVDGGQPRSLLPQDGAGIPCAGNVTWNGYLRVDYVRTGFGLDLGDQAGGAHSPQQLEIVLGFLRPPELGDQIADAWCADTYGPSTLPTVTPALAATSQMVGAAMSSLYQYQPSMFLLRGSNVRFE